MPGPNQILRTEGRAVPLGIKEARNGNQSDDGKKSSRALVAAWLCCARSPRASAGATRQTAVRIDPAKGGLGWLTRPYQPAPRAARQPCQHVAARLADPRWQSLSLGADVVALALENNIDIEVQRYGPLLAREVLRRAEGGGLLRNPGQGIAAGTDQRQPQPELP